MAIKVPDEGEIKILDWARTSINSTGELRLFQNNYTPVDASTNANFTEATFSGYASGTVNLAASATVGGKATATAAAAVTFTHNGGATGNTIYGYWIKSGAAGAVCLWAERFAGPVTMNTNGQTITIQLSVTLASET